MFKITKNNGIDMLTKNGRFIQSIDNFKKDIKSTSTGKLPAFVSNVYKNTNDNNIKNLIETGINKNVKKINIGGKVYDIDTKDKKSKLKKTFELNNAKLKELIFKSSLRIPVFAVKNNTVSKIDIDKPLLYKKFDIDNKKDLINVFTGDVKRINNIDFNFDVNEIKTQFTLNISFDVLFSDNYIERNKNIIVNDTLKKLNNSNYVKNNYVNDVLDEYRTSGAVDFKNIEYTIKSSFNTGKKDIKNMIMLKQENVIDICNIFNKVIKVKNNGSCVNDYITDIWASRRFKNLDKLKTPDDIYKFCVSKKIKTICYDICGNVINKYYPDNGKIKALIYICYNNHIYPLEHTYLERNNKIVNIKYYNDKLFDIKLNKLLNHGVTPGNVKLDNNNKIVSFVDEGIKYINNPEYEICKKVLDIYGLTDNLYDTIHIRHLGNMIEKLYLNQCNKSFMPIEYTKEPYIYTNNNIKYNDTTTIDKNKCYSNALYNLDFLIKTDIRCNEIYNYVVIDKDLKFVDEYLYVVEPDVSSLLMPNKDLYSGYFLNYCKNENLNFIVYNTIVCEKVENEYKKMIEDIYDKLNFNIDINGENINCAKYIINILIGKFNQRIRKVINKTNINIISTDDLDYISGHTFSINDNFNVVYDTYEDVKNIRNRLPIDIQVKDESRRILYNKMLELNITNDNVIQIKTDSITINKKIDIETSKHWTGWKYEKYNPINSSKRILKDFDINNLFNRKVSILYDCYAGAGKSHHIKETYKNNNDYIILTPKHSANKDYKKNKYNCDVIQKYEFSGEVPNKDIIIVDEIGQVSSKGWDVIFKCAFLEKKVVLYGDFKQLSPIDSKIYNTTFWRNYFYRDIKMINTNYRNNNSIDYYNDIINNNINYTELKKYNNLYSDNVIVYRNKTRIEYNNKICTKKGIKNLFDVGNKIICINNKLNGINIYNGFTYIIKKSTKEYIITDDDTQISKKDLKHFDYAWATTIHKIQGETLNDMYVAPEDNYFYKGNVLYTIISRLKQPLSPETMARNNNYINDWN